MTVRAKLQLSEIRQHAWNPSARVLIFRAQYDDTIPEDQKFQKATPTAVAEFNVDNPAALAQFELGKCYYVDFTAAP